MMEKFTMLRRHRNSNLPFDLHVCYHDSNVSQKILDIGKNAQSGSCVILAIIFKKLVHFQQLYILQLTKMSTNIFK